MDLGKQRYNSLDGLRGAAALVVVLLHYVSAFAPFLIGIAVTTEHTRFDHSIITFTPLQLPVSGNFAVSIFFVLSGFVLSISFFKHKTIDVITSSASKRYFRLMIPALSSILVIFMVMRLGLLHNNQAAQVSQSGWFTGFWQFPANLLYAVYQGVYGIFFTVYSNSAISYNPVLWTMHYELIGSFLIFMFLAVFGKLNNRSLIYAVFGIMFLRTYYLGFIAGMAMADICVNYPKIKNALSDRIIWLTIPLAIVLGTWTSYTSIGLHVYLPSFNQVEINGLFNTLGAIIIVFAVLRLKGLAHVFESKPLQYLGKISFSIYLLHFVVIGSLGAYLFSHFEPHLGYKAALLITFIPTMAVSFGVAHLFTKYIDTPSIAWSKKIGQFLLNGNLGIERLSSIYKPKRIFKHAQSPHLRAILDHQE